MFSLLPMIKAHFLDDNGDPLSGGKIETFLAGSTTPADTYTDATGSVVNTNPIILDARGEADIWLSDSIVYKIVLRRPDDSLIYTVDNVSGGTGGGGGGLDEKVKLSFGDPVTDYLINKLGAGENITLTVQNAPTGDSMDIAADNNQVSSQDGEAPGYLEEILISGVGIQIDTSGAQIQITSTVENTDETLKVSSADTTADYLDDKISGGDDIETTIVNPGSNEQLLIDTLGKLKVNDIDDTKDYLINKVLGEDITLSVVDGISGKAILFQADPQTGSNTGLKTGGAISLNLSVPNTYDVQAGTGVIFDHSTDPSTKTDVIFPQNIEVPINVSASFTSIGIDSSGVLFTKEDSVFTNAERRDYIVLGGIIHIPNAGNISVLNNPQIAIDLVLAIYDWVRAIGIIKAGALVVGHDSDLMLDRTTGVFTLPNINHQNDIKDPSQIIIANQDDFPWFYQYRDGLGGYTIVTPEVNVLDPGQYDNGSGSLVNLNNNDWQIQLVFFIPLSGQYIITYGQESYSTLDDAILGLVKPVDIDPRLQGPNVIQLGTIIIRGGAGDLSSDSNGIIRNTDKFGGTGGGGGGGTTDLQKAFVAGNGQIKTTAGKDLIFNGTNTSDDFYLDEDTGNIGIGTAPGAANKLDVLGDTYLDGNLDLEQDKKIQIGTTPINATQITKTYFTIYEDLDNQIQSTLSPHTMEVLDTLDCFIRGVVNNPNAQLTITAPDDSKIDLQCNTSSDPEVFVNKGVQTVSIYQNRIVIDDGVSITDLAAAVGSIFRGNVTIESPAAGGNTPLAITDKGARPVVTVSNFVGESDHAGVGIGQDGSFIEAMLDIKDNTPAGFSSILRAETSGAIKILSFAEDTITPNEAVMLIGPGGTPPIKLASALLTDTYFDAGNVGIKTKTPDEALEVVGNVRISSLAGGGNVQADINGNLTLGGSPSGDDLQDGFDNGDGTIQTTAAKDLTFKNTAGVSLFVLNEDNEIIDIKNLKLDFGNVSNNSLEIGSNIGLYSSGVAILQIASNGSDLARFNATLGTRFYTDVGIGIDPSYALDVVGGVNVTDNFYINGVPIGGAPKITGTLFCSKLGDTASSIGELKRVHSTDASIKPVTRGGSSYQNGDVQPWFFANSITINSITIGTERAAIATAGPPTAGTLCRISVYTMDGSSRTLLQHVDIPLDESLVNTFNNLSNGGTQIKTLGSLGIVVPAETFFGVEFTNQSGDGVISSMKNIDVNIKYEVN